MGFWGTFVVHRDERLLWELLPGIAAFDDAEICYDGVSGGWQVTRVFAGPGHLPTGFLADLREASGAPVLAADVFDSDAAFVRALGLDMSGWQAWLDLDAALAHLVPPPAPFAEDGTYLGDDWSDPDHDRKVSDVRQRMLAEAPEEVAAAAAAAWAVEAGLEPGTVEQVREVLGGHEVFVEDLFFTLLNRLGIATDEVHTPARPAIVEVLRGLFGHRLNAIEMTAHRPARGERLAFRGMPDLRLHFDGRPTLIACGCGGEFTLLPTVLSDDCAEASKRRVDGSLAHAVSVVLGRPLTDAATVRHRYLPDVKGVVLRFGGADLFVVAVDGRWTVAKGSTAPTQLMNELGPHRRDEIHVNPWLAG